MKKVSKSTLTIRALVAVYLLYLVYGLIQDYKTVQNQTITLIGIIVFTLCGGLILFTALRSLIKGDYEDGSEEEQLPENVEEDAGQYTEEEEKDTE